MRKYKFRYNLDHPLRSVEHKRIIENKRSLKRLYINWYNIFKQHANDKGTYLELGSGGGFIKEIIPGTITSDLNEIPDIDYHFSASNMPFNDNSLDGIFMIDSFHHFANVKTFFCESERVLKENGKIVMIEPWFTKWSGFIYRKFHHELFDPNRDWNFPEKGPLSGSNMALPYIVFERDKDIFTKQFKGIKLSSIDFHTPFTYLLTGGFSRSSFLPNIMFPLIHIIEKVKWLKNNCAMFATIIMEKKYDA